MVRRTITFLLSLSLAQAIWPAVWSGGILPGEVSVKAADPVGAAPSASTVEQFVVQDTFDDNTVGAMWRVLATDPNDCRVQEANQRLELRVTGQVADASAGYVSSGWRLDPRRDFAIKVDWYFDLDDLAGSWISFGVAADADDPWERNAVIGVAYKDAFPNYWYRKQMGVALNTSMAQRVHVSGQLCVSYNAADDELYLGFGGYGAENAWATFPGLLKQEWGARPVFMWLAGGSTGSMSESGRAYLDNLRVDSGTVIEASLRNVHRFWSATLEEHFYTISEVEKEILLTQYGHVWKYEKVVYRAFSDDCDPDSSPVHRFWSPRLCGHFYTLDEIEKDWLIAEYPHVWTYEGVAFYAYPEGKQPTWACPVYRFWSPEKCRHFYTTSEAERENLQTKSSGAWVDEGTAWYALP